MRVLAIVAIVTGCAVGTAAVSAAVLPDVPVMSPGDQAFQESWGRLREAVYARSEAAAAELREAAQPIRQSEGPAAEAGVEAPLTRPAYSGTALDSPGLLTRETYVPNQGLARWKVTETAIARPASQAIDAVRLSVGQVVRTPGGLPPRPGDASAAVDTAAYEVTYTRGWPRVMAAGGYDLSVTPHAGVGISNAGGEAEAGAVVRLSRRAEAWLDQLGAPSGDRFGTQGRWYLFGAASGRAVGLNMLHDKERGWTQGGLSTDSASALVSDVQAGVGWRKGSVQASLAWLRRKVKGAQTLIGLDNRDDTAVAFTLSIKPRR